jgi:pseudaminic acid synthase
MKIAGVEVANGRLPYLIAEISCNHCGSLDKARELIAAAKAAGADAVKFQAYTPDTITIDHLSPDFLLRSGPWKGKSLYQLYKEAHTPFEWFPVLYEHADKVRIPLFASVFDKSSVDMLEKLGCPAYKIASMEIVDLPLIRYAAATGKPMIISTGMASDKEIVAATMASKRTNTAFLACVSNYPARDTDPELYRLRRLQEMCDIVGISDHTLGDHIAVGATALGASIIEKHFILDIMDESHDANFSLDPEAFSRMRDAVHNVWMSVSSGPSALVDVEEDSRVFRRSIYVVEDIKKGQLFTEQNIRSIRPGFGMEPAMLTRLVGRRKAAMDLTRGTALKKEMVK